MSSPQYYNSSDLLYCKNIDISGTLIANEIESTTIKCDQISQLNQNYISLVGNLILNQSNSFIDINGNILAGNLDIKNSGNIKTDGNIFCGNLNCLGTIKYQKLDPALPLSPIIIQKASGTTNPIRFLRIGGAGLFNFSNYFEFEINLNFRLTDTILSNNLLLALSINNGGTYFSDSVEIVSHEMNVGTNSFQTTTRFNGSNIYGSDGFALCGLVQPEFNANLRLKFRDSVGNRTSASYEVYFQKSAIGIAKTIGCFGLNSNQNINMLQFSFAAGFIDYSYNVIAYPR
jgi:hypothetical protein